MNKTLEDKMKAGREYRNLAEFRAEDNEDYVVTGYASTFNEPYLLWRDGTYTVREQVDPHAFDETDMTDVIMQYDHVGRVFARKSNGTLELSVDDHGLKIDRAYLGGTEIGRQLFEEIRGGYTSKMSFGFIVEDENRDVQENAETGEVEVLRTITRVSKLFDVSAVSLPANDGTTISARNLSDGLIAEVKEEIRAAHERAETIKRIKEKMGVHEA